jgi:hypothetical protein
VSESVVEFVVDSVLTSPDALRALIAEVQAQLDQNEAEHEALMSLLKGYEALLKLLGPPR